MIAFINVRNGLTIKLSRGGLTATHETPQARKNQNNEKQNSTAPVGSSDSC